MRVVWFELDTPEQELAFERYRKLLRALRREGHAAVYDLVSRPGAHYVAWEAPPLSARPLMGDTSEEAAAVRKLLEPHGYTLQDAELYTVDGKHKVYSLAGGAGALGHAAPTPPLPPPRRRLRPRWRSVRPPPRLLPWLPGLVLALLGVFFLTLSLNLRATNPMVVMPDVLGADVNAASALLYEQGLTVRSEPVNLGVGENGAVLNAQERGGATGGGSVADVPAGAVVDLEPSPGTRLRRGRTALVLYALPPGRRPPVEVPDLRGRPFEGALRETLEASGLTLGRVAHAPSAEARGLVIAQSLPPGSAPEESELSLLVSEGPEGERVFPPDLQGKGLTEALEEARAAGFGERVETTWVAGADAPPGTVLSQNLTPFLETPLEGATLRLLVAGAPDAGSAPRAPDLIGMTRADAEETANETPTDAALRFKLIDEPNLPAGVVSQTPPPDAPLDGALELTLNRPGLFKPEVQVARRTLELRRASYRFPVEANVPASNARVEAHYLSGKREVVEGAGVSGGDVLNGTWLTTEYGPVTFVLYLNNIEYARVQDNP